MGVTEDPFLRPGVPLGWSPPQPAPGTRSLSPWVTARAQAQAGDREAGVENPGKLQQKSANGVWCWQELGSKPCEPQGFLQGHRGTENAKLGLPGFALGTGLGRGPPRVVSLQLPVKLKLFQSKPFFKKRDREREIEAVEHANVTHEAGFVPASSREGGPRVDAHAQQMQVHRGHRCLSVPL